MVRSKPDDYANQAVAIYTHGMMKLPFGRTKVQKIETTIAALVKRGDQLAAKRAKAVGDAFAALDAELARLAAVRYVTTTAVPLAVTMSIEPFWPTVS